jgi:hypothetical protein
VRSENREDCNKAYLLKNLDVLGHILDLQRCDISYDIAGEDAFVDRRQENDGIEKNTHERISDVVLNSSQQSRHV